MALRGIDFAREALEEERNQFRTIANATMYAGKINSVHVPRHSPQ